MAYTTINKSSLHFNSKLYTGNGGTQTISGIGFEPSLAWFKARSSTSHMLQDQCRGKTKFLESNNNTGDQTSSDGISSFNSDGYAIGANGRLNSNNTSMVSWNWKANGQGSSNTAGSINTTYTSANTTSGCSIITYTGNGSAGATIGHGMGIKPSMIIIKNLTGNDWIVYTQSLTANKILYLNTTGGQNDNNVFFNDVEPTSSLITLGSISATNGSGVAMVAYCFSDVQGYSKQGSYVGNGNANGTFVYTGFKPAWVLIKRSNAGGDQWQLSDSKRGFNGAIKTLFTDSAEGEVSGNSIDFVSNGFKNRSTSVGRNGSGSTYVYMAFAEEPLVSTNGVAATAR